MAGKKKANPHVTVFCGVSQKQQEEWIATHGNFFVVANLDAWNKKTQLCARWCVVFPSDTLEDCCDKFKKFFPEEFHRDIEGTKDMARLLLNPNGMSSGKTLMMHHTWPARLLEIVLAFHPHLGDKDSPEGMKQANQLAQIAYKLVNPKKA